MGRKNVEKQGARKTGVAPPTLLTKTELTFPRKQTPLAHGGRAGGRGRRSGSRSSGGGRGRRAFDWRRRRRGSRPVFGGRAPPAAATPSSPPSPPGRAGGGDAGRGGRVFGGAAAAAAPAPAPTAAGGGVADGGGGGVHRGEGGEGGPSLTTRSGGRREQSKGAIGEDNGGLCRPPDGPRGAKRVAFLARMNSIHSTHCCPTSAARPPSHPTRLIASPHARPPHSTHTMQLRQAATPRRAPTRTRGSPAHAFPRPASDAAPAAAAAAFGALLALPGAALAGDMMTFDGASNASAAAAYAAATAASTAGAASSSAASASSGILDALTANPLLVAGAAAGLAVPALIASAFGGAKGPAKAKSTPAPAVLALLEAAETPVLLDIRSKEAVKAGGAPRAPARTVALPFTKSVKGGGLEVDPDFADRYAKLKLDEDATIVLLDGQGREAAAAAAVLASAGAGPPVAAFVADGVDGPKGWKAAGAPWKAPSKGLSLKLPKLTNVGAAVDALAEDFKTAPSAAKAGLAGAAIIGAAALIFQEAEAVLELAGVFAAARFAAGRLLFADDRRKTVSEFKELVDDKIAVGDVGSDLKKAAAKVMEPTASKPAAPAAVKPAGAAGAAVAAGAPAAPAPATPAAGGDDAAAATEANANAAEAKEWVDKWRAKQA